MATPLSLSNFVSFFFPSKAPTAPKLAPTQVSTPPSSSPTQFQTQTLNSRDGLANEDQSSSNLSSVICPSLAYSNTLYSKVPYHVEVIVDDNEGEEMLVSRFRRDVMRSGIIREVRRRRFHENKQDEKKRRVRDSQRRNRKRRPFSRQEKDEASAQGEKKDEDEEDDDNWELPEGMEMDFPNDSALNL